MRSARVLASCIVRVNPPPQVIVMWLDSSVQRRKVIDGAIEVAAYIHKNEDTHVGCGNNLSTK